MADYSFKELIKADYRKIRYSASIRNVLTAVLFSHSFKRILAYRLEHHFYHNKFLRSFFYVISRHYSTKYSVFIDPTVVIGKGFNIAHCFSIIIAPGITIGDNVTILQQVTLGDSRGGGRNGRPSIGSNVMIGCGAKVLGNVTIGSNVVIGANSVVTKDIPDGCVVGGVPARIIGSNGAELASKWTFNYF